MTAHAMNLLRRVQDAGGSLEPNGGMLKVRAPKPLPVELVDELRQAKTELLAILADNLEHTVADVSDGTLDRDGAGRLRIGSCSVPAGVEPGPGASAETWCIWHQHLVNKYSHHGNKAAGLAYGALVNRWHLLHGEQLDPGRCAGCGDVLGTKPQWRLPDGAWVHDDTQHDCLIVYGKKWRGAAIRGLTQIGIKVAPDFAK